MKNILLSFLLILLVSCNNTTPEKIQKLQVGMNLDEAKKVLGEPYRTEYITSGPVLHYRYWDGAYKNDLKVYIENGKVDSWW